MGVIILSRTSNWYLRVNTCFYIKVFNIDTGFLKTIFSINSFFNFVIDRICWFFTVLISPIDSSYLLSVLAEASTHSSIVTGSENLLLTNSLLIQVILFSCSLWQLFLLYGNHHNLQKLLFLLSVFQYLHNLLLLFSLRQLMLMSGHWHLNWIPIFFFIFLFYSSSKSIVFIFNFRSNYTQYIYLLYKTYVMVYQNVLFSHCEYWYQPTQAYYNELGISSNSNFYLLLLVFYIFFLILLFLDKSWPFNGRLFGSYIVYIQFHSYIRQQYFSFFF